MNHRVSRERSTDLWGSSCESSSAITAASAEILGVGGYAGTFTPADRRVARLLLNKIRAGRSSIRTLFSGRSGLALGDVSPGDEVVLPIVALSDDEDFARTFAQGDRATLLRVRPGARVHRYSDVEWLTAGKFLVERVVEDRDPFWDMPLRIVDLVPPGTRGRAARFRSR